MIIFCTTARWWGRCDAVVGVSASNASCCFLSSMPTWTCPRRLHIPKCGTSFYNTLYVFYYVVPYLLTFAAALHLCMQGWWS